MSNVKHLISDSKCLISHTILKNIHLPAPDLISLFKYGAIYHRAANCSINTKPKRIHDDIHIDIGDYVRVHTSPRLYPEFDSINWEDTIIFNSSEFMVINKPGGVPSQPNGDNSVQNCLSALKKFSSKELFLPHRLDTNTTGLLVICHSKEFLIHLNNEIKNRRVKKIYKALLVSKNNRIMDNSLFPNKILVNYLVKSSGSPKVFLSSNSEGSLPCYLKIVNSSPFVYKRVPDWLKWFKTLSIKEKAISFKLKAAMEHWLHFSAVSLEDSLSFGEVEFELITGRTHQIRGQVACLGEGTHIAGDNVYCGMTTSKCRDKYSSSPFLALESSSIEFSKNNLLDMNLFTSKDFDSLNYKFELEKGSCWWHALTKFLYEHRFD